jgi:hypothetical protein
MRIKPQGVRRKTKFKCSGDDEKDIGVQLLTPE